MIGEARACFLGNISQHLLTKITTLSRYNPSLLLVSVKKLYYASHYNTASCQITLHAILVYSPENPAFINRSNQRIRAAVATYQVGIYLRYTSPSGLHATGKDKKYSYVRALEFIVLSGCK